MAEIKTENPSSSEERGALPIGTRLQEFELLQVIGGGGFGIVYLARDHFLERHVALKEFMPPMASRAKGSPQVIVNAGSDWEAFEAGLDKFLNEARLLARFDHPALVKVLRFWQENGTAYMAMPFYLGSTLHKVIAQKSVPEDERSLRQMLSELLDAVAALHAEKCYHRDISPDNILLTPAGPLLLDFGAARRAIGAATGKFTAVLKEGYAPLEQYAIEGVAAMRQGPWTDIYALSGVMRYIITGSRPLSALARSATRKDPQEPLARTAAGRYSKTFLSAIDTGMERYVEDRPQSIAQFRAVLDGKPARVDPAVAPETAADGAYLAVIIFAPMFGLLGSLFVLVAPLQSFRGIEVVFVMPLLALLLLPLIAPSPPGNHRSPSAREILPGVRTVIVSGAAACLMLLALDVSGHLAGLVVKPAAFVSFLLIGAVIFIRRERA